MAYSMSCLQADPALRGSVVVEDRNWGRVLDCNGGVSEEYTLTYANGYPIRGYWENNYVVAELSNGQRRKLTPGSIGFLP